MSDPKQCTSQWRLITTPVRGCGRFKKITFATQGEQQQMFPSNGSSYSSCGSSYSSNAWFLIFCSHQMAPHNYSHVWKSQCYPPGNLRHILHLSGGTQSSLTHGAAGSQQHVRTFAAALYETYPLSLNVCPCTNTDFCWPYQVPSFIENNYFCDTANTGPGYVVSDIFPDDPLWDGEGCGPTNACCQFNNPPWFCMTLPQPTTELRIWSGQEISNEDVYVQLIDNVCSAMSKIGAYCLTLAASSSKQC